MKPVRYFYLGGLVTALGLGGWLGWKLRAPSLPASIDTDSTTVVREVTRETRPDGTIIESEKETSKSDKKKTVAAVSEKPKYSVGVQVRAPITDLSDYRYGGEVYRRVSDTNLWVGAGYSSDNSVSVGVRIDF